MSLARLIASGLGAGRSPWAPGTAGSLLALLLGALLMLASPAALPLAALAATIGGVWAIRAARVDGDPGWVVIDEVAGQWLTLCFVPLDPYWYLASFFLFRAADIVKPFPANWCDRNLKGGLGIMLDDMVAGLYAGLALFIAHWLIGLV